MGRKTFLVKNAIGMREGDVDKKGHDVRLGEKVRKGKKDGERFARGKVLRGSVIHHARKGGETKKRGKVWERRGAEIDGKTHS